MFRTLPILAFGLLGIISSSCADENKENLPQIVVGTGHNFPEGTFKKGMKWQALFCDKKECEVKNIKVKIAKRKEKNVLEEYETIDDLKFKGKPIALFPNGKFNLGKVQSWHNFNGNIYNFWESPQFKTIKETQKWQMNWSTQPLTLSWVQFKNKDEPISIKYSISDGKVKQELFETPIESHYGGDTTPIIHWVGDLDGDGKIDLILSLPDDNCGFDERLYLSSRAEKGKLVKESAQISGSEAACGC